MSIYSLLIYKWRYLYDYILKLCSRSLNEETNILANVYMAPLEVLELPVRRRKPGRVRQLPEKPTHMLYSGALTEP